MYGLIDDLSNERREGSGGNEGDKGQIQRRKKCAKQTKGNASERARGKETVSVKGTQRGRGRWQGGRPAIQTVSFSD